MNLPVSSYDLAHKSITWYSLDLLIAVAVAHMGMF